MTFKAALLPFLPDDDHFIAFLDSPVSFCFGALRSDSRVHSEIGQT
jgi:hypothetical protein